MASTLLYSFSIFLYLLCASAFSAATSPENSDPLDLSLTSNLPKLEAEKLIRGFNLSPKKPVNTAAFVDEPSVPIPSKSIVERPLKLNQLIDGGAGPSVQEFGHHSGYYKLPHSKDARMFYFFFESRKSKNNDPIVIWLTGGPGCSSELALFYENGPFHLAKNLSLQWNDYGWDQASNLLFVDQPTGTGFSYTSEDDDIRHDEKGVSNDLYDFLQAFFAEHPSLAKRDFYITGESYAGHYIPALASRVHQGNKAKEGIHINLKGLAIGNGLTDPEIQYKAYTDYALDMQLIKKSDYNSIQKLVPVCEQAIKLCGSEGGESCTASYVVCNNIFNRIMKIAGSGLNHYDIRKKCEGDLCYDFSNMEEFLNLGSVREALGVGNMEFVSCSRNSRWVHAMKWSGQKEFGAANTIPFVVDGAEAGQMKSHGALTFLKVHDAGHMVPMDQPKAALQMLKSWMQGKLVVPEIEQDNVAIM
ncbi:hypothetical protein ACFE04_006537 [Oxalis oulophora]